MQFSLFWLKLREIYWFGSCWVFSHNLSRRVRTNPIAIASVLRPSLLRKGEYAKVIYQGDMFSLEERPGNRGRSGGGRHRIRTMLQSEIKDPIGSQQKARNKLQERIEGVMATSFKFNLVPVLGNNTHVAMPHLYTKAYLKKIINSL